MTEILKKTVAQRIQKPGFSEKLGFSTAKSALNNISVFLSSL